MNCSLESLYDIQKKIQNTRDSVLSTFKCKMTVEITETILVSPNISGNVLASFVSGLVGRLDTEKNVMESASVKIKELQSDQIINQKGVIQLQEEQIRSNGDQVETVQSTVKTEIKLLQ